VRARLRECVVSNCTFREQYHKIDKDLKTYLQLNRAQQPLRAMTGTS
jgi:hypothetical protein